MPNEARDFDEIPSEVDTEPEDENPDEVDGTEADHHGRVVGVTSDATQTEGDIVDGAAFVQSHPLSVHHNNNRPFDDHAEPSCSHSEGGFLSSFFTMVLPAKKRDRPEVENSNSRSIATQTEELDPITARGQQLSHLLIQELSLRNIIPASYKDDVYESLASCICDMLVKHSILFNGMVRRCHVTHYHIFSCIANEIFEANASSQLTVTWGRIISLFAFAVRLAQEYREFVERAKLAERASKVWLELNEVAWEVLFLNLCDFIQDEEQVDSIIRFLASYVTKYLIPFIRSHGGWEGLVVQYPAPVGEDAQMKRAILWSGLCVGLMATMYVSSYLSSR